MKRIPFVLALVVAAAAGSTAGLGARQGSAAAINSDTFKEIALRSLGPALTTGRVADIAVDPNNPDVYYVAAAAGGLWKSENRGDTWRPIFDNGGAFNMCCVVVDPKNSNVLWLGTGENSVPRSAMIGDGLYKSTDAGASWKQVGLAKSEHIGKIVLDPRDSNVVYVASQGPLWSSGGDRGVFKTTDGGATWKAYTVSPNTGANDIVMDPNNPDVLYASMWQRQRGVGQFIGGGPESAIYKTTNAGATWTKLTNGLPKGDMGRIALAVDLKANPTRVYALANALRAESGFYRSDDAGETWVRYGHEPSGGRRGGGGGAGAGAAGAAGAGAAGAAAPPAGAQAAAVVDDWYRGGDAGYYHELFVDTARPDTIWSTDTSLEWSRDGGKTWGAVPNMNGVHVDFHAVWTDAKDARHILVGSDGGAFESWDEGRSWRHFSNLPITQFYRVATDNATPFYHVCGGAQDNGSMCGPSRTTARVGIRTSDWYVSGGGDGFFNQVDPVDPNYMYSSSQDGAIERLDLRTGQSKGIRPGGRGAPVVADYYDLKVGMGAPAPPVDAAAAGAGGGAGAGGAGAGRAGAGGAGAGGAGGRGGRGGGERTNWDCPYIISPHLATRVYWGSNFLYRSDDRGDHWTRVSPDLTKSLDPDKIPIMGKVWDRATTVSYNQATTTLSDIVAIDESPLLEGLLYVGTDDGLLQVSEDGGHNWRKVDTFPGVPAGTYLTSVKASPRDSNVLFVTLNNWQRGDYKPYVLRSDDRGRTFKSIAGDLPPRFDAWVTAQDHINGNLIFLGTEWGLFVTVDGGTHWVQLKTGLPTAQVRDMKIQKRENDLVLATFGRGFYVLDDYSALRGVNAAAMSAEAALMPIRNTYEFEELGYVRAEWGNERTPNPPFGATFTYNVGSGMAGNLALMIADDTGREVSRMPVPGVPGLHRATWNLSAGATGGGGGGRGGGGGGGGRGGGGAMVPIGTYTATIGRVDGDKLTPIGASQTFQVLPLPARNY
jgi:hypothetical protein